MARPTEERAGARTSPTCGSSASPDSGEESLPPAHRSYRQPTLILDSPAEGSTEQEREPYQCDPEETERQTLPHHASFTPRLFHTSRAMRRRSSKWFGFAAVTAVTSQLRSCTLIVSPG